MPVGEVGGTFQLGSQQRLGLVETVLGARARRGSRQRVMVHHVTPASSLVPRPSTRIKKLSKKTFTFLTGG